MTEALTNHIAVWRALPERVRECLTFDLLRWAEQAHHAADDATRMGFPARAPDLELAGTAFASAAAILLELSKEGVTP